MNSSIRSSMSAALAGLFFCCALGCSEPGTSTKAATGEPVVYTTFYPTAYFTDRIAGDRVRVVCPVPDGEDPIFWKPSRDVLAEYQQADLIVVNGAEFEKWIAHVSLPASRIVDSAAGLPGGVLEYAATQHRHGLGGEHTHQGIDGHTWMDPLSARHQVGRIAEALGERWPEHEGEFRRAGGALQEELVALHSRLSGLEPRVKQVTLLASHPAYDYLARGLGWTVLNFDLDPEGVPDEGQLKGIEAKLEGDGVRLLLW